MTCFYIVILGISQCLDAPAQGVCHPIGDGVTYCTIETVRGFASYYDPALCPVAEWDTNCLYVDGISTGDHLGDGTPTGEGYGRYMACPMGMYWKRVTFELAGTWQCRDHGTAVNLRYQERYTSEGFVTELYAVFDMLETEPQFYTYELLEIIEVN